MEKLPRKRTLWTRDGTVKESVPELKPVDKPLFEQQEDIAKEYTAIDTRVRMVKPHQHIVTPRLNEVYDSLRTSTAWRHCADAYAIGNFSVSTGGGVTSLVQLQYNRLWELKKWPSSPQLFLVMTYFSCCPRVVPATPGNITITYIDNSGYQVQLGVYLTSGAMVNTNQVVIPNPITDIGANTVGSLSIFMGTGSNIQCDWQAQFSTMYLLPAHQEDTNDKNHY